MSADLTRPGHWRPLRCRGPGGPARRDRDGGAGAVRAGIQPVRARGAALTRNEPCEAPEEDGRDDG
jgi:hypothetical protein